MSDPDGYFEKRYHSDLIFLNRMESGHIDVDLNTHPSWFDFAIREGKTKLIIRFLDLYKVPQCDNLKQRVALYQLIGANLNE